MTSLILLKTLLILSFQMSSKSQVFCDGVSNTTNQKTDEGKERFAVTPLQILNFNIIIFQHK
jgi:hypothetical protein